MTAKKKTGRRAKIIAVLITSLGPVLANVLLAGLKGDDGSFHMRPHAEREGYPGATDAKAIIQVIVEGAGSTPDEAVQQALRNALQRAAPAGVDANTGALPFCESVGLEGAGIIRGWKEIGGKRAWTLRGAVHHKELAVELDRHALAEHLRRLQALPLVVASQVSLGFEEVRPDVHDERGGTSETIRRK